MFIMPLKSPEHTKTLNVTCFCPRLTKKQAFNSSVFLAYVKRLKTVQLKQIK